MDNTDPPLKLLVKAPFLTLFDHFFPKKFRLTSKKGSEGCGSNTSLGGCCGWARPNSGWLQQPPATARCGANLKEMYDSNIKKKTECMRERKIIASDKYQNNAASFRPATCMQQGKILLNHRCTCNTAIQKTTTTTTPPSDIDLPQTNVGWPPSGRPGGSPSSGAAGWAPPPPPAPAGPAAPPRPRPSPPPARPPPTWPRRAADPPPPACCKLITLCQSLKIGTPHPMIHPCPLMSPAHRARGDVQERPDRQMVNVRGWGWPPAGR